MWKNCCFCLWLTITLLQWRLFLPFLSLFKNSLRHHTKSSTSADVSPGRRDKKKTRTRREQEENKGGNDVGVIAGGHNIQRLPKESIESTTDKREKIWQKLISSSKETGQEKKENQRREVWIKKKKELKSSHTKLFAHNFTLLSSWMSTERFMNSCRAWKSNKKTFHFFLKQKPDSCQ